MLTVLYRACINERIQSRSCCGSSRRVKNNGVGQRCCWAGVWWCLNDETQPGDFKKEMRGACSKESLGSAGVAGSPIHGRNLASLPRPGARILAKCPRHSIGPTVRYPPPDSCAQLRDSSKPRPAIGMLFASSSSQVLHQPKASVRSAWSYADSWRIAETVYDVMPLRLGLRQQTQNGPISPSLASRAD